MKKIITLLLIMILSTISFNECLATNDTFYEYQYYLDQINVRSIWNQYTGKGVTVAVIDDGVHLDNNDLAKNIWRNNAEISNMGNGLDDDNNGYIDDYYGYNFYDNNNVMETKGTHGTAVAGIIGAKRDNGFGVAGIAPDVTIMPLIVCNAYGCPLNGIDKAIRYATDNGADIINLSLGSNGSVGYSTTLNSAIKYAYDRGVLIISSAGNGDVESGGQQGENLNLYPQSPVCNDTDINMILGVGATTRTGIPTNWSNYSYGSKYVDFSAPGVDITVLTVPAYNDGYGGGSMNGTSFSAPMVSGVVALLKEKKPEWKNWEIIGHMLSHSNSSKNTNTSGKYLDAQAILNQNFPKTKLRSVSPSVLDGQTKIMLQADYLFSDINLKIYNTNRSVNIPKTNLKFIDYNNVEVNLSSLDLEASSNKYGFKITGLPWGTQILKDVLTIKSWPNSDKTTTNQENISIETEQDENADCPILEAGDLFKIPNNSAIYLIKANNKRLYFPSALTYNIWFKDYTGITEINPKCTDNYQSDGAVAHRPGSTLIKTVISPTVYALLPNKQIRPIKDEAVATKLYGATWNKQIIDVPDYDLATYKIGEPLNGDSVHDGMIITIDGGTDTKYYIKDGNAYPVVDEIYGAIQNVSEDMLGNIQFSEESITYSSIMNEIIIDA